MLSLTARSNIVETLTKQPPPPPTQIVPTLVEWTWQNQRHRDSNRTAEALEDARAELEQCGWLHLMNADGCAPAVLAQLTNPGKDVLECVEALCKPTTAASADISSSSVGSLHAAWLSGDPLNSEPPPDPYSEVHDNGSPPHLVQSATASRLLELVSDSPNGGDPPSDTPGVPVNGDESLGSLCRRLVTSHPLYPLVTLWCNQRTFLHRAISGGDVMLLGLQSRDAVTPPKQPSRSPQPLSLFDPVSVQPMSDGVSLPNLPTASGGSLDRLLAPTLSLWKQAGGDPSTRGRGAPLSLRVWYALTVRVHQSARDGNGYVLSVPARELVGWLYPDGWANPVRDWPKLIKALKAVDLLRVPFRGGLWRLLAIDVLPCTPHDRVVARSVVHPSQRYGPKIDWYRLARYGVESSPLYRAHLAAAHLLDDAATRGIPLTQNSPSLRLVKRLTADELTRTLGLEQYRSNRKRALDAYSRLADDGVIDLVREGNKWMVLGPPPEPDA